MESGRWREAARETSRPRCRRDRQIPSSSDPLAMLSIVKRIIKLILSWILNKI